MTNTTPVLSLDQQIVRLAPGVLSELLKHDSPELFPTAVRRICDGYKVFGDQLMRMSDGELERNIDEEMADYAIYRAEQIYRRDNGIVQ